MMLALIHLTQSCKTISTSTIQMTNLLSKRSGFFRT
jgi:hypothetical protein